jgi:hypothetical protein
MNSFPAVRDSVGKALRTANQGRALSSLLILSYHSKAGFPQVELTIPLITFS